LDLSSFSYTMHGHTYILKISKVHYNVHNGRSLLSIPSQMNPKK